MSLLGSHIQVHDGLLTAMAELLLVADRALTEDEIAGYLQPAGLAENTLAVVPLIIDVMGWLQLAERTAGTVEGSATLRQLEVRHVLRDLPGLVRRQLIGGDGESRERDDQAEGRDLARALAWLLAQDAWNPPPAYEKVIGAAEDRQTRQLPNGPELVNKTKWVPLGRWAAYLGLGSPDPIERPRIVPDPTVAIREELARTDQTDWSAREFTEFLAAQIPALDGGDLRIAVTEPIAAGALPWEEDDAVLSPSLSLAIFRLEHNGVLTWERRADSKDRRTLTLPESSPSIDRIRVTQGDS